MGPRWACVALLLIVEFNTGQGNVHLSSNYGKSEAIANGHVTPSTLREWAIISDGNAREPRGQSMVDFDSGLWHLLSRTPMDDFQMEDNGLSKNFYKYLTETSKRVEGRTKQGDQRIMNQEKPFQAPYQTVFNDNSYASNIRPHYPQKHYSTVESYSSSKPEPDTKSLLQFASQLQLTPDELVHLFGSSASPPPRDSENDGSISESTETIITMLRDDVNYQLSHQSSPITRTSIEQQQEQQEQHQPYQQQQRPIVSSLFGQPQQSDPKPEYLKSLENHFRYPDKVESNPSFQHPNSGSSFNSKVSPMLISNQESNPSQIPSVNTVTIPISTQSFPSVIPIKTTFKAISHAQEHPSMPTTLSQAITQAITPITPNQHMHLKSGEKESFINNFVSQLADSSPTNFFLSTSFVDPSLSTSFVDPSFTTTTEDVGLSSSTHSLVNQEFQPNFWINSNPVHIIDHPPNIMFSQGQLSELLDDGKDSSQTDVFQTNLRDESATDSVDQSQISNVMQDDNQDNTFNFLSKLEEDNANNGFYNMQYNLNNFNQKPVTNKVVYGSFGSANSNFDSLPSNLEVNDMINTVPSVTTEIQIKPEVPEKPDIHSVLQSINPPLPAHVVQMVYNISDIFSKSQSTEDSLTEVYQGFRDVFRHAGKILASNKASNNSWYDVPESNIRPDAGSRLVIIYRPVVFVSHGANGSWSKVLGEGYRPTVMTGDGEKSEALTQEVLNTLGPDLLEKIREHFAKEVNVTVEQNIERVPVEGVSELREIGRRADKYILMGDSLHGSGIFDKMNRGYNSDRSTYAVEVKNNLAQMRNAGIRRHGLAQDIAIKPLSAETEVNFLSKYLNNKLMKSEVHKYRTRQSPANSSSRKAISHNIIVAPSVENQGSKSAVRTLPRLQDINPGTWWFSKPPQSIEEKPKYVLRRITKRKRRRRKQTPTLNRSIDRRIMNSREMQLPLFNKYNRSG